MFNVLKLKYFIKGYFSFRFRNLTCIIIGKNRCLSSNQLFSVYCLKNIYHFRYIAYGLVTGIGTVFTLIKFSSNMASAIGFVNAVNLINVNAAEIPVDRKSSKTLSRRAQFNFLADVVQETSMAVVYIEIYARNSFTKAKVPISNGSGFIVKSDGLILTNAHVVHHYGQVVVKLQDGRVFHAVVDHIDSESDLATVRIQAENLPTLPLGESSSLRPGEFIIAMGNPLNLSHTITAGVVSSPNRKGKELGLHPKTDYVQTDAAINAGSSGGPLINLDGEVIGINTMKVSEGISFAVPSDRAKAFLMRIAKDKKGKENVFESNKRKKHKFLGITMMTLTSVIIKDLKERDPDFPAVEHGLLVWRVMVDSPSYKSGIRPGDVITKINDKEVHTASDVMKLLETENKLRIVILRSQKQYEVEVPLIETDTINM